MTKEQLLQRNGIVNDIRAGLDCFYRYEAVTQHLRTDQPFLKRYVLFTGDAVSRPHPQASPEVAEYSDAEPIQEEAADPTNGVEIGRIYKPHRWLRGLRRTVMAHYIADNTLRRQIWLPTEVCLAQSAFKGVVSASNETDLQCAWPWSEGGFLDQSPKTTQASLLNEANAYLSMVNLKDKRHGVSVAAVSFGLAAGLY